MTRRTRWLPQWSAARTRPKTRPRLDDRGATIVEYTLLLSLIAVVAVGSLVLVGKAVSKKLVSVSDNVAASTPAISVGPSTATDPTGATDTTGDLITLTAALTGASLDAGGSINFYVSVQAARRRQPVQRRRSGPTP